MPVISIYYIVGLFPCLRRGIVMCVFNSSGTLFSGLRNSLYCLLRLVIAHNGRCWIIEHIIPSIPGAVFLILLITISISLFVIAGLELMLFF